MGIKKLGNSIGEDFGALKGVRVFVIQTILWTKSATSAAARVVYILYHMPYVPVHIQVSSVILRLYDFFSSDTYTCTHAHLRETAVFNAIFIFSCIHVFISLCVPTPIQVKSVYMEYSRLRRDSLKRA